MKNIQAKITSNKEIAPACFRMVLSGPFEDFSPRPGQFIMLRVGNGYDPLLRRPFAAYRLNTLKGFFVEIFYKVVGHGTRMMSSMFPDTRLELLGPLGNGFKIPDKISTAFILAGGMGIVPLRGLIRHFIDRKTESIHVFIGARSASHFLFQQEFQEMEISFQVSTEDGSAGHHGLVTELFSQFLNNFSSMDEDDKICFACGPLPMLETVARITSRFRLSCQVSLESRMACGIGACLGCAVKLRNQNYNYQGPDKYVRVCLEGPVFDAREIEW
ncbi:MAG: dihydroorotate dehydrogenase electron transfer subunit [Deltaproteobacteria bacterium]|nr:dihydroorotate dehydrogenase electron transfer subunit [Deltaproteobacteria bacterium]